ncbi:phosphatidate cytidylyltransferase [Rhodoligotrophos appendicifer]|uniref:phosphatidate cytidylyltransferase n=1 Tax=Rhodoligotrophos appendicifer TaxID=987056 RepID=UPI00147807DE|nr:phosphatidate cytidylyltransferase [Rhodoligotrophos appendicifer]
MASSGNTGKWADLAIRSASAAVLVPIVVAAVWLGGPIFAALLAVVGLLMATEWLRLVYPQRSPVQMTLHIAAVVGAVLAALFMGPFVASVVVLLAWAASVAHLLIRRPPVRSWSALGIGYVAIPVLSLLALRLDPAYGLAAIIWLLLIVWSADTAAYLVGRLIGGPKLAPRISPGKTRSGFGGALLGGAIAAGATGFVLQLPSLAMLMLLGAVIAAISQLGDLFESLLKRHAEVKDSGHLIPGHGGILDRVDGLITAAIAAWAIGAVHGGFENIASGLLVW